MKSYIKNILILVLLTLIVLPFVLKRLNVYEGMDNSDTTENNSPIECVADYSYKDNTQKMSRK